MRISLLTDAPKHNLALMKISTWHKAHGNEVKLNMPLWGADLTYASILFEWNKKKFIADYYGGPAFNGKPKLKTDERPDYDLFGLDYSLGYTYRYCPRGCQFCKVGKVEDDKQHYSIWDFHLPKFKKICLLNNNTFFDSRWRETFEEIWDAKLIIRDENGYDLRLINEEKATALKRTKWDSGHDPHFAWDRMEDEKEIICGLNEVNRVGIKSKSIYVLIGFDTTLAQDIYRCQKIYDMGHDPFPMIYKESPLTKSFRRMIYARYYRKLGNIEKAWKEYSKGN